MQGVYPGTQVPSYIAIVWPATKLCPLIALSFCAADNMASCSMASCGSRVSAFKGTQVLSIRSAPVSRGVTAAVMVKKGIHPDWHPEAKVMCNGVEVGKHFQWRYFQWLCFTAG